jgi:chemotaxis protein methyltransferase CheR
MILSADPAPEMRAIAEASAATGPAFDARDMRFFAREIRARVGILLPESKAALVFRRLAPRVRALGFASFAEYRSILADADSPEWERIVGLLTTNHSRFFREIHHFKLLQRHIEERLADGARRIRLWSAACASGQEPYSMAMILARLLDGRTGVDARVLATDVDREVLAAAEAGCFGLEDVGHLPRFARGYMRPEPDAAGRLAVSPEIRGFVRFRYHNLVGDSWPMRGPFDVIFCRNMLIYLSAEDQARVVRRLADLLRPGGILCLGHSEVARKDETRVTRIEVASSYVRT